MTGEVRATGVGCIYIKEVDAVDIDVLAAIVARSYEMRTAGVYPHRARDAADRRGGGARR